MRSPTLLASLLFFVASCSSPADTVQAVVDRALAAHGGDRLDNAEIEFDFRDKHFLLRRDDGQFHYERTYTDSTGQVREVLNNDGLFREVNGTRVPLDSAAYASTETAVNSVAYFVLLPLPLNDPAVIKKDLGTVTYQGEPYRKIEVRFHEEGGGRDFDDWFVYWFHRDRHTMDYLAYYFHVNDTGSRFRTVLAVHEQAGVRLQDYANFTYAPLGTNIEQFDALPPDSLAHISDIRLDNLQVRPR